MKKQNRILALSLLPFLVASCQKSGTSNSVSNNPGTSNSGTPGTSDKSKVEIAKPWWSTTGELEKDSDGNIVFDDVEITLDTIVNGDDNAAFDNLIAAFNREYSGKITVEANHISQDTFDSTVTNSIKNNTNAPDLIMSHQKGNQGFVNGKYIQPFDDAMEQSGINISLLDYSESLSKYCDLGYTGYTFGIPCDAQTMVVYYNKQELAKVGNTLPTTHQELVDLCKQYLSTTGNLPIAWDTSNEFFGNYVFSTAIVQNGGQFYDASDSYHVKWGEGENLTAFKKAFQSLRDLLYTNGTLAKLNDGNTLSEFCNNKALFYLGLPWSTSGVFSTYASLNGNLSVESVKSQKIGGFSLSNWFEMDASGGNGSKLFGDSHFFTLSSTVKDITKKAACLTFVKWFTQTGQYDGKSVGVEWAEAGHMSASTVISTDTTYSEDSFVNDFSNQFIPDINTFEVPGNTPYYSDTWAQLKLLFNQLITNTTDSNDETAIKTAAKTVNDKIDAYNEF